MSSLGFKRLNVKKTPPNERIDFIKPLPGKDEEIAQDFLEKIAAQCYPVMKKNYINVRSLEEYEPNREFVGRNFNAGEVIQLVLKAQSGRWLPFDYVQMVMMHELAHCKQMNHSKAFWAVRNQYAGEMLGLRGQGYTGEGLWGRGRELSTGHLLRPTIQAGDVLPEHICGGTYRTNRRGGRKRKAKSTLTWKEQKERRVLKKFGAGGVALGEDEDAKVKLEQGKKTKGKPRVAQSQRGRELRAAAALARFGESKKKVEEEEEPEVIKIESDESGDEVDLMSVPDAVDIDGKRLVDKDGVGMVKVCDDDGEGGEEASEEMRELLRSFGGDSSGVEPKPGPVKESGLVKKEPGAAKKEPRAQPTVAELFKEARQRKELAKLGGVGGGYK
ncbi:uncharacterized protein DNG_00494 [Cephalotrichum gorgonifer]|uniref:WLM domain-containing protein n=1 Tax=Cephalotrichum gorgonifer TaxID=2041049 RepID=A0AAE8MPA5_9PEZI|nr:uncharacterized protein DNG_00494 [Cephalotrichum gorgonifer]